MLSCKRPKYETRSSSSASHLNQSLSAQKIFIRRQSKASRLWAVEMIHSNSRLIFMQPLPN